MKKNTLYINNRNPWKGGKGVPFYIYNQPRYLRYKISQNTRYIRYLSLPLVGWQGCPTRARCNRRHQQSPHASARDTFDDEGNVELFIGDHQDHHADQCSGSIKLLLDITCTQWANQVTQAKAGTGDLFIKAFLGSRIWMSVCP